MVTRLDILKKLKATGYKGFEGLICTLLERLTVNHFYLAKSGFQAGGDMAAQSEGTCVKIECKRYQEPSNFNERELRGEIEQAYENNPELDLWVLVTSRDVDMQLIVALKKTGEKHGIEVSAIEKNDEEPGALGVLCAFGEDIVINHIAEYCANLPGDLDDLKNELLRIKSLPGYEEKVAYLKNTFNPAEIGYDNWIWATARQDPMVLIFILSNKNNLGIINAWDNRN